MVRNSQATAFHTSIVVVLPSIATTSPLTTIGSTSSRSDAPIPTTVMSFVRPHWLTPSMLMLATVFSSG